MKYFLLILITCSSFYSVGQSKKELEKQVSILNSEKQSLNNDLINLKIELLNLKEELLNLKEENLNLKNNINSQSIGLINNNENENKQTLITNGSCQAITNAGKQCSRKAVTDSNYCWQHKSTYEPTSNNENTSSVKSTTSSGRTIYTGPRGGKYYINSNGNKTYIKH